jgi:hypothetical protein
MTCKGRFCFACIDEPIDQLEPTFEIPKKLCHNCNTNPAEHVRKMNLSKVPKEYILRPGDIRRSILTNIHHVSSTDKIQFVNLPKEHTLTKYDYYLCQGCYQDRPKELDQEWNYWGQM